MTEIIRILVGTMTGNAEIAAEEIEAVLAEEGDRPVEIIDMQKLDATVFDKPGLFVICTSTYGQGDVPDNATKFYTELTQRRPDLSHVRYGVFGLGDSTYVDTFNFGGKRFDDILQELGAQRIGERAMHNASSDVKVETMSADWARAWLAAVEAAMQSG